MRRRALAGEPARGVASSLVIAVSGELDIYTAPLLRDCFRDLALGVDVAIDAAGISFLDSTGIGVLVGAAKRLRDTGNHLVVRHAQSQTRKVLDVAGVLRVIRLENPAEGVS